MLEESGRAREGRGGKRASKFRKLQKNFISVQRQTPAAVFCCEIGSDTNLIHSLSLSLSVSRWICFSSIPLGPRGPRMIRLVRSQSAAPQGARTPNPRFRGERAGCPRSRRIRLIRSVYLKTQLGLRGQSHDSPGGLRKSKG